MLVGQQLGDFTIDREVGAGAMGTVYRGRYTRTGQVVAVKVMAPGLGSTNPHAAARFEREAAILKQLRHPNIVRLFGHGKYKGTRYYAMEYVEGESLDRVMARRGRMSWEEVVALGQQLCSALQHAHERGIVHRDIKPSNIMVLRDGTLKLTDFGIAKDLDGTQLTSAHCTVGTAAYMSPEQCKGERDLTHKSDLYSLGVMFYELVTGRKPFLADNAMEMFLLHVQGTFERPSRLVLDLPVWFDTLLCQMLEKKPEQRPLDAATVGNVLAQIQEKVEAQQSAGVEVVRARRIDLPRGQRRADAEDREAARTLLAATGKGRRKRKPKPFYRRLWFQAAGIGAGLAVVAVLLWLVFRPPSQERLYQSADRVMAQDTDNELEVRELARERVKEYLKYYGKTPGPQTDQARAWLDDLEVKDCEWKLKRHLEKPTTFKPQTDLEEKTFRAAEEEDAGELEKAKEIWQTVSEQEGSHGWGLLAERHVRDMAVFSQKVDALLQQLQGRVIKGEEPKPEGPERLAFAAARAESLDDLFLARQRLEDLKKESVGKPAAHFLYLFAVQEIKRLDGPIKKLEDDLKKKDQDKEQYREEQVRQAVNQAADYLKANKRETLLQARTLCMEVLALYSDNSRLKPLVEEARKILEELGKK